jgi:hypothetical protein
MEELAGVMMMSMLPVLVSVYCKIGNVTAIELLVRCFVPTTKSRRIVAAVRRTS